MKRIQNIFILLLILCCLGSCGKNESENPQNDPNINSENSENTENKKEENTETHISGKVIRISHNSDGIADFTVLTDNDSVCRITPGSLSENAVTAGQEVLVTVDGKVTEADPMQAVAKTVDVTDEFNVTPTEIPVYSVYGIEASKVAEALTSSGFRFYRFKNYDECLDFLQVNDLYSEFTKAVGNTDISALTESFFSENDLGLFVVNSAENQGNELNGVLHREDGLYLSIIQNTENAVFVNTKFDAFLLPLSKDLTFKKGYVLTESFLNPNLGEDE